MVHEPLKEVVRTVLPLVTVHRHHALALLAIDAVSGWTSVKQSTRT